MKPQNIFSRALLFCFFMSTVTFGQNLHVKLTERLVLGDDEDAANEYLFVSPQHICTDRQNNIYVADKYSAQIRIFDQKGRFVKAIGQKGKGPGEFEDIAAMTIAHNNDLLIVDRLNRRFTRFRKFGSDFIMYSIPVQSTIDPFFMQPFGRRAFILGYLAGPITDDANSMRNVDMFHIYTNDFRSIKESCISATDIWNFNNRFERAQSRANSLNCAVVDSNSIIVAPKFYEGILYKYEKVSNIWKMTKVQGKVPYKKSYDERPATKTNVRSDIENARKSGHNFMILTDKDRRYFVYVRNRSVGLFQLNNGQIVHFSIMENDKDKAIFGLDIFTKNGKHIGYGEMKHFPLRGNDVFGIKVLWKDVNDHFYISDTRDIPVIRCFSLQYNVK